MRTPIQALLCHSSLRKLHNDNRGVTTVEYVIVLVIIGVVAIGAWKGFGASLQAKVKSSDDAVQKLN